MKILINGEIYKRWTEVIVDLTYDTVGSTFSLKAPFDPTDEQQRRLLLPLAYNRIEIFLDDDKLLTGTILNHENKSTANPTELTITGYSICGVLADCEIAEESYPLQDTGKTLADITRKFITPFGVELHVNEQAKAESLKVIDKTTAEEADTPAEYIAKLASQFNVIVGNTRNGRLLFTKIRTTEAPQSNYIAGVGRYVSAALSVDGRRQHSRYIVKRQSKVSAQPAAENSETTINNSIVNSFRPKMRVQSSGDESTIGEAAKNLRSAELANISFSLDIQGQRYDNGKPIKPNRVITLQDEQIFLFKKTKLFVRGVTLTSNSTRDDAKLNCVLVEALTGEQVNINTFKP